MFVVYFKFYTDGDFGFPYVPRGMKYDGDYEYELKREFNSKSDAIDYAVKTADYLSMNVVGNKYQVEELRQKLYRFEEACLANRNENVSLIASEYMSGNYDGTVFCVEQKMNRWYFDFPVNDTQNILVNEHAQELREELRELAYRKLEEYAKRR